MDPTLKSRIETRLKQEAPDYSPRMRMVAKYILDHPAEFGLQPVRSSAARIGVSTYTLVRVAKSLGFDTFDELRAPFRHALVAAARVEGEPDWIAAQQDDGRSRHVLAKAGSNALSIVQNSLQRQTPEDIDRVVSLMLDSDRIFVTASRASYALAYYFHYVGRMALPALRLIPRHMNSAVDELNEGAPEDMLFAILTDPYSQETVDACEFAQARGMRSVFLSDSEAITPALHPDHVLVASTLSTHHFACYAGLMTVTETLLAALVHEAGDKGRERIQSYETLRRSQAAYWSRPKKNNSFS